MSRGPRKTVEIPAATARAIWLAAQRLDVAAPFGDGPQATRAAVEHLGYVQIDTINVIERSHHHILYTRIPGYSRAHLRQAQREDRCVFEYWTHALSYVPTRDLRFFLPQMAARRKTPDNWHGGVTSKELSKVLTRIRRQGPLSIRDIDDDVLVDKEHPWASRKPSKRALERAFYDGRLVIVDREGMLKTYELAERHFGRGNRPKPATPRQINDYVLDRALRSQGLVSLDSICHLDAPRKPAIRALIDMRVRRRSLVPVLVEGAGQTEYWMVPELLETKTAPRRTGLVHILSPFDPLVIQRKRLALLFGYDHVFEAYVKKEKRRFGYFTLPVLAGDEIVAAIDLKTDRTDRRLLIQQWHWIGEGSRARHGVMIDEALGRFEAFQFGD